MDRNPSQPRRQAGFATTGLTLQLAYRPPYAWSTMQGFLAQRLVAGLEWTGGDYYGRSFLWHQARGQFTAVHDPQHHGFRVTLELDDMSVMQPVVANIRRILDLDADTGAIEAHLARSVPGLPLIKGLRLPGTWSLFEAGIRAILGQQVSIGAARRLVQTLVDELGEPLGGQRRRFPEPATIAASDLAFLKMPGARRETLRRLAQWLVDDDGAPDATQWLALKGIGPWTVDYARMRGASHPDIWLGGDLGVKKALGELGGAPPANASPWRSYLTFQLWNR